MNTGNFEKPSLAPMEFALPRRCVLEGFAENVAGTFGVCVRNLNPHDLIICRTQNSQYRLLVLDPPARRVRVQGGELFTEPTEAVLNGSSYGGSMIRLGWICTGMRIEFVRQTADKQIMNLLTSPVEAISLEPSP
ncbi:MAG TPA: hypothetical protein PLD20_21235 [Blastocatellia bacterium]|nr:hypothetical protein [Blastocatellia bacterium]HMV82409.1 hypothetical protein [Blastocatellia bacterium]HMY76065.1 hypothetical protein [Blastocatellia bacterium]HMZ20475.1 hypothetical protein [Blastocatellia bacterium]HNG33609.1 hypothetical protein [Blastocatellia bacterium]